MFRSNCTLAATLALVLPCGCFIDGGSGSSDSDPAATTGEIENETTTVTGSQISVGHTETESTATTATEVTTDSDTTEASTQDTTAGESDPTVETGDADTDTDIGTDTDTETDTETEGSSSTDGTLLVSDLDPGDLVITEVMANPNCTLDNCEWFELYNATDFDINIMGLGIGDRGDFESGTAGAFLSEDAILPSGELGVIARQELWPYEGVEPLARYSNAVQLSNGTFEQVVIYSGNTVLDVTAIFLPNNEPGRSRALMNDAWDSADHTDSDDWCWSNTVLPSTSLNDDWGTPGTDLVECLPPS